MRTPWRFVADLVSRKPKTGASGNTRSTETEIKALGYKPAEKDHRFENDAAKPVASADIVHDDETGANSVVPDVISRTSSVFNEQQGSPVEVSDPVISQKLVIQRDAKTSPTPVENKPKRGKKSEKAGDVGNAVAPGWVAEPAVPVVAKTFIEEAAELNAEVDVLRHQLARKLREQNAQLRKMLSRFEAN